MNPALKGTGRTAENDAVLTAFRKIMPDREYRALEAWISTFYGFQQTWLLDQSDLSVLVKSRQIGASHTFGGASSVLWALFGEDTALVSLGKRESAKVLKAATKHAAMLAKLGSRWARQSRLTTTELTLMTGATIEALPSTSGARGQPSNVVLDEVAYYKQPEDVWDAASGATTHGFRMRVASTPNGVGSLFHRLATEGEHRHHRVTVHEAIADGMVIDLARCRQKTLGDPRIFAQVYECSFLDGDLQYIPTALVDAAKIHPSQLPRIEGHAFAGLDIGLENDLSSLSILKLDRNGVLWEQETTTCKRTSWEDQEALIQQSFVDWQWRRISTDKTGLGMVPAQRLQSIYGERVEPVAFTLQSKEVLATGLYQALAEKRLIIRDDPEMIRDICSLRRIVTSNGNVTYDAPRNIHGHADRAWSLALAVYAASPFVKGRAGGGTEVVGLGSNV